LEQIYHQLRRLAEQHAYNPIPMLFLGPTLPEFSLFKNVFYQPLEYRLQAYLVAVLRVLWNDGNPQTLRPNEIDELTGSKSAYGNHRKLSLTPWNLVETVSRAGRKLNERGIQFMQGNLEVPLEIVFDYGANDYVEKPGCAHVTINDVA
jgi:hypothetical protein